jgi:hypothetical protein
MTTMENGPKQQGIVPGSVAQQESWTQNKLGTLVTRYINRSPSRSDNITVVLYLTLLTLVARYHCISSWP